MMSQRSARRTRVVCKTCGTQFECVIGRAHVMCPKCGIVSIRDVRFAAGELTKFFG